MTRARLVETRVPPRPAAAALVLHGGAQRPGNPEVSPTQLSVLRMVPVARQLARSGRGRLAVFRLLNSSRGWDASTTPVDDVTWALATLAERYGDLPVGLVGHSLGGRAALLAGSSSVVRSVVALNAWVYPTDAPDLRGKRVLFVHGTDDRVADPSRARAVARRLSRHAAVTWVDVPGGRHAMLRHGRRYEQEAARFTTEVLAAPTPGT